MMDVGRYFGPSQPCRPTGDSPGIPDGQSAPVSDPGPAGSSMVLAWIFTALHQGQVQNRTSPLHQSQVQNRTSSLHQSQIQNRTSSILVSKVSSCVLCHRNKSWETPCTSSCSMA